jgi:arylformamidase
MYWQAVTDILSMHDNATTTAIYRSMDRAALDAAYNNSAAVSDSPKWLDNWRARAAAQVRPGVRLAIPYAPRERTKIDYFPAGVRNAPLFVFIHGGYWVRNSREMFSFLADGPNAHGIDVVVIGYTLAPEARLSQIVDEVGQCLTFLAKQSAQFGFNDDGIFVGGWSAGGHLSAMACEHPAVRGALPISGIFDLEPVSMNYLNDPLQLSHPDIERLSRCVACALAARRSAWFLAATNCRSCKDSLATMLRLLTPSISTLRRACFRGITTSRYWMNSPNPMA